MHTLTTLGFLAIGVLAILVMFMELRRRHHYIAYLLKHRQAKVVLTPAQKRQELVETIATGTLFAAFVFAALVWL